MTGRLLDIPRLLVDAGLHVSVVGGWEARGKATMRPDVVVLHHTAGPQGRNAPSLAICIDGRSNLPGPLCHVLIGRDGTCHVIASGVAHHAGKGSWQGVTGNRHAIGIEVEHAGTSVEPWRPELVDVSLRCAAALAAGYGIPTGRVCGHKEWAPTRKVDPYGWDMNEMRARIDDIRTGDSDDMADDVLAMHMAYYGLKPGTAAWTLDVIRSFDYHLGRLARGEATLDQVRSEFAATVGL